MGELNLIQIARELLAIHEEFPYHLKNYDDNNINDFEMETFTQLWCSNDHSENLCVYSYCRG